MKDTPAGIERKFRQMLLRRSGEERLKLGCSMHSAARALVKASISQQHPRAHDRELKRLLCIRIYGNDFDPEERKRIASAWQQAIRAISENETSVRTAHVHRS